MATVGTTGAGCPLAFACCPLAFACCPGALPFGTLKEVAGGEEEDGGCGCGADSWPPVDGGGGCSV